MGSEQFNLQWNDFEWNISSAIGELRNTKDFFDVTLACEDDIQIQAHKIIVSACSPFFHKILSHNPHEHPLLYLKGVKHSDLLSILHFMYQGEVNVAQEELKSFLAAAEDLKVKGLSESNPLALENMVKNKRKDPDGKQEDLQLKVEVEAELDPLPLQTKPSPIPDLYQPTYQQFTSECQAILPSSSNDQNMDFQENCVEYVQYEDEEEYPEMSEGNTESCNDEIEIPVLSQSLEEEKKVRRSKGGDAFKLSPPKKYDFECDQCGKAFRDNYTLSTHVKKAHFKQIKCERCGEQVQGSENWRAHTKKCFYTCEHCDFVTKNLKRMEGHKRKHAKEENKSDDFSILR